MTSDEFVRWVLRLEPEANAPDDLDAEQASCFRRVREEAAKVTPSGDAVITVYRRMEAAAAGARAERDIMRAAIEAIAVGTSVPIRVAQAALDADRDRREANLAALSEERA